MKKRKLTPIEIWMRLVSVVLIFAGLGFIFIPMWTSHNGSNYLQTHSQFPFLFAGALCFVFAVGVWNWLVRRKKVIAPQRPG